MSTWTSCLSLKCGGCRYQGHLSVSSESLPRYFTPLITPVLLLFINLLGITASSLHTGMSIIAEIIAWDVHNRGRNT